MYSYGIFCKGPIFVPRLPVLPSALQHELGSIVSVDGKLYVRAVNGWKLVSIPFVLGSSNIIGLGSSLPQEIVTAQYLVELDNNYYLLYLRDSKIKLPNSPLVTQNANQSLINKIIDFNYNTIRNFDIENSTKPSILPITRFAGYSNDGRNRFWLGDGTFSDFDIDSVVYVSKLADFNDFTGTIPVFIDNKWVTSSKIYVSMSDPVVFRKKSQILRNKTISYTNNNINNISIRDQVIGDIPVNRIHGHDNIYSGNRFFSGLGQHGSWVYLTSSSEKDINFVNDKYQQVLPNQLYYVDLTLASDVKSSIFKRRGILLVLPTNIHQGDSVYIRTLYYQSNSNISSSSSCVIYSPVHDIERSGLNKIIIHNKEVFVHLYFDGLKWNIISDWKKTSQLSSASTDYHVCNLSLQYYNNYTDFRFIEIVNLDFENTNRIALGRYVYQFFKHNDFSNNSRYVLIYDSILDVYTRIDFSTENTPIPRNEAAWCTDGTYIYMYGGYTGTFTSSPTFLKDIWRFDPNTYEWVNLGDCRYLHNGDIIDYASCSASMVYMNNYLYIYGGCSSNQAFVGNSAGNICYGSHDNIFLRFNLSSPNGVATKLSEFLLFNEPVYESDGYGNIVSKGFNQINGVCLFLHNNSIYLCLSRVYYVVRYYYNYVTLYMPKIIIASYDTVNNTWNIQYETTRFIQQISCMFTGIAGFRCADNKYVFCFTTKRNYTNKSPGIYCFEYNAEYNRISMNSALSTYAYTDSSDIMLYDALYNSVDGNLYVWDKHSVLGYNYYNQLLLVKSFIRDYSISGTNHNILDPKDLAGDGLNNRVNTSTNQIIAGFTESSVWNEFYITNLYRYSIYTASAYGIYSIEMNIGQEYGSLDEIYDSGARQIVLYRNNTVLDTVDIIQVGNKAVISPLRRFVILNKGDDISWSILNNQGRLWRYSLYGSAIPSINFSIRLVSLL